MSKHTPGPWVLDELAYGHDIHAPEARCYVATATDPEMVWGAIVREEDARLIAAAPELLEALEEIVKEYCENPDNGRTLRWAIDGAKEAIAKAKGEE